MKKKIFMKKKIIFGFNNFILEGNKNIYGNTFIKTVPPHCVVNTLVSYYCIYYAMKWNSLYVWKSCMITLLLIYITLTNYYLDIAKR